MQISTAFPSKWLKAADLQGKEREVQIDSVMAEDIGDGDAKPVVYFANAKKGLVLNKTNAQVLASQFGDETDTWSGKKVVLFSAKVSFNGQMVDGLRVRVPQEKAADDEEPPF